MAKAHYILTFITPALRLGLIEKHKLGFSPYTLRKRNK